MLNRLLFHLAGRLPCRLISLDSGPYLERYYLGTLLWVTFYLHRFVSSDSERHVHNHPWKWGGSVILAGGYTEERLVDLCPHWRDGCVTRFIKRRWFNVVNGNTFHRIHDAKPGIWTLFFHGARELLEGDEPRIDRPCPHRKVKRAKGWGFLERACLASGTEVTAFKEWPSLSGAWWKTAPTGAESEREPL